MLAPYRTPAPVFDLDSEEPEVFADDPTRHRRRLAVLTCMASVALLLGQIPLVAWDPFGLGIGTWLLVGFFQIVLGVSSTLEALAVRDLDRTRARGLCVGVALSGIVAAAAGVAITMLGTWVWITFSGGSFGFR